MFRKKETINFKSFMNNTWREEKAQRKEEVQTIGLLSGATVSTLMKATPTYAIGGGVITKAFDPIVALIQDASYPVGFIMITGGMLLIMIGQRHRGIAMIKWSAIGYIGMQLAPAIMDILATIGKEMRAGY